MAKLVTKKQVNSLVGKIDRYNKNINALYNGDIPFSNLEIKIKGKVKRRYVEKNYEKLEIQHKKKVAQLEDLRNVVKYRRVQDDYNKKIQHGMQGSRLYYTVSEQDILSFSKNKKEYLKKFTKLLENQIKVGRRPNTEEVRSLKDSFKKLTNYSRISKKKRDIIKTLNKSKYADSFSDLTRVIEDIKRVSLGRVVSNDEQYYINFLTACLRVGAFGLYNEALRRGYNYVEILMIAGFFIDDIYMLWNYTGSDASWRASEAFENEHISETYNKQKRFKIIDLEENDSTTYGEAIYYRASERHKQGKLKYDREVTWKDRLTLNSGLKTETMIKESYQSEKPRLTKLNRKRLRNINKGKK